MIVGISLLLTGIAGLGFVIYVAYKTGTEDLLSERFVLAYVSGCIALSIVGAWIVWTDPFMFRYRPLAGFQAYVAAYKPRVGHVRGSDRIDVRKSDSIANPYIGVQEFDEWNELSEEHGDLKYRAKEHWEIMYEGDGSKWRRVDMYVTATDIVILEEGPLKIGKQFREKLLGKRRRVALE